MKLSFLVEISNLIKLFLSPSPQSIMFVRRKNFNLTMTLESISATTKINMSSENYCGDAKTEIPSIEETSETIPTSPEKSLP